MMKDGTIQKIGQWAKYIGAIANWAADSLVSFPKRSEFVSKGDNKKSADKLGV
jgi:hypothetical protein